jgi:Flp pilus assembly protein CpaB
MARGHLFVIALLLAGAAVAGLLAFEAQLQRQLDRQATSRARSQAQPVIQYRRPPAVVVTTHRAHEDDGSELEALAEGRDD